MHTLDLNKIELPKKLKERTEADREKTIKQVMASKDVSKSEAESLTAHLVFDKLSSLENAIFFLMDNHLNQKFFNKEKGQIIAPWDKRKIYTKIKSKVIDSEKGVIELSDEQLDFLIEATQSDAPQNDIVSYLCIHLEDLKIKK